MGVIVYVDILDGSDMSGWVTVCDIIGFNIF